MTNTEIENIFKSANEISFMAGLRAVWNAGWYEGAGKTPSASAHDKSIHAGKPTATVTPKKK